MPSDAGLKLIDRTAGTEVEHIGSCTKETVSVLERVAGEDDEMKRPVCKCYEGRL